MYDALAGVLGPLDRLGVGTRVRKDGPAQRWLVPGASETFAELDIIPTNNACGQGQVLEKGRASSRKRAITLRHHARAEWAWVVGPLSYEPVGMGSPVPPYAHRARLKGSRSSGQHGRAFGLGLCPRGEEMFPGAPWWRGNRGTPGGVSRAV